MMVQVDVHRDLRALRDELGFPSYTALFAYVILEFTKGGVVPPASPAVFQGTRPVVLTGPSQAGKTTWLRAALAQAKGNVFVLDTNAEYKEFREVGLGEVFGLAWQEATCSRLRFVPNRDVRIAQAEAQAVFQHLNFVKSQLKDWTVVVEEAHRFGSDQNLRTLELEAGKFVRKLILVTAEYEPHKGVAQVFRVTRP